jgi:hypothetical protein
MGNLRVCFIREIILINCPPDVDTGGREQS